MSAAIPAGLVKELRDQTGAGMMDCKRALEEAGGDLERARTLLRERGMARAGARAGRETTEGIVLVTIADGVGAMVAVGCETEPVAKNAEFLAFAEKALETVEEAGPEGLAAVEDERLELVARLGENVAIRGAVKVEAAPGESLAEYVHPPAHKIGVLVRYRGGSPSAGRRLAMHVAASRPRYLRREDVPAGEVASERAILEKQPEVVGKPEEVRPRIVEGMLAKRFFAEVVLLDQAWIHDPGKTVAQALREEGMEALEFWRLALAE